MTSTALVSLGTSRRDALHKIPTGLGQSERKDEASLTFHNTFMPLQVTGSPSTFPACLFLAQILLHEMLYHGSDLS